MDGALELRQPTAWSLRPPVKPNHASQQAGQVSRYTAHASKAEAQGHDSLMPLQTLSLL